MNVLAPAKLTVSLRITGVRADGYHLIDAEMVSIDLCDELSFGPGDGLVVEEGTAAGALAGGGFEVPAGEDNLVRRALTAVGRRADVRLVKRIPAGAGLGGGSADAAAVLRWAGRTDDVALAAALGADVPFCVRGGRARVSGIGEVLEPLPCRAGAAYTLLIPPFGVSTAAAYRAWDAMGGPGGDGANDLEAAALAVE
ncbi:MAG TPA: 4-(cytidine 5'-diphospho)-2-C-methyl-D-erythritol kinase, partial [Acidimicrobiales bacterium]